MDRNECITSCLALPFIELYFPFDDVWAALRHMVNRRCMAFVYVRDGVDYVNLKCDPILADDMRRLYSGVTHGYHMNKRHWITVRLDAVPDDVIADLLYHSFDLTKPKPKRNH